jgi:hypothetical protein
VLGRSIARSATRPGMRSKSAPEDNRNIHSRAGSGKHIQPEITQAAFENEIACSGRLASKNSRRKRTVDSSFLGLALDSAVEEASGSSRWRVGDVLFHRLINLFGREKLDSFHPCRPRTCDSK